MYTTLMLVNVQRVAPSSNVLYMYCRRRAPLDSEYETESVCVRVRSFHPYFYMLVPLQVHAHTLRSLLSGADTRLKGGRGRNSNDADAPVCIEEAFDRHSIYTYLEPANASRAFRIVCQSPLHQSALVRHIRTNHRVQALMREDFEKRHGVSARPLSASTSERWVCDERGRSIKVETPDYENWLYEHVSVPYELRFAVDCALTPFGWFRVPTQHLAPLACGEDKFSSCAHHYELSHHCHIESLSGDTGMDAAHAIATDAQLNDVVPLVSVYFDIETVDARRSGRFPSPSMAAAGEAQVFMIAVVLVHGVSDVRDRRVFHLRDVASTESHGGGDHDDFVCVECASELDLVMAFAHYVRNNDADLVSGFNSNGYDMPFLYAVAQRVRATEFRHTMSRMNDFTDEDYACDDDYGYERKRGGGRNGGDDDGDDDEDDDRRYRFQRSEVTKKVFESRAYGRRELFVAQMHGRVSNDLCEQARRALKLPSYTLNAVASAIVGDTKDDVDHRQIPVLFDGSDVDRRALAHYCHQDTSLVHRIEEKLLFLTRNIEMCRVTGVDLETLLQRGQQIKVVSQMLRYCRARKLLLPLGRNTTLYEPDAYIGGTVFEPNAGFYNEHQFVSVVDFASLYPSLIISLNMCYSTLVPPRRTLSTTTETSTKTSTETSIETSIETSTNAATAAGYGDDQVFIARDMPTERQRSVAFVRASVRKGVLPAILELLLAQRKRAKRDLGVAQDPFLRQVLDARQLALKVSANSVYGFTGVALASGGKLPLFECCETTTGYGRVALERTRDYIERRWQHRVIYGDTDSVFYVDHLSSTLEQAFAHMNEVASAVTADLFGEQRPMRLEGEKIYAPFVLITRKRYIGAKWEGASAAAEPKLDYKGIELARRGNSQFSTSVLQTACEQLFLRRDTESALRSVRDAVCALYTNAVPLESLAKTTALSRDTHEYKTKQPHVALVERMRKRDAGSAPRVGDRVRYVMAELGGVKALATDMAECPEYMREYSIPVNAPYYVEKELRAPIERIFTPVVGAATVHELFTGAHTRRRVSAPLVPRRGAITQFFAPIPRSSVTKQ